MVASELQGTRLPLQMKRVWSRMSYPAAFRAFCLRSNPRNIGSEPGAVIGTESFVSGRTKLTIAVLTSEISMSPTGDRHARHQHDDTTEKQDGTPQQRWYDAGSRQPTA